MFPTLKKILFKTYQISKNIFCKKMCTDIWIKFAQTLDRWERYVYSELYFFPHLHLQESL
jgi:hypothetical protein